MSGRGQRGAVPRTDSVLSVAQGADGVWTVSEHGQNKSAISYFSSRWAAMKHAVRAARSKANGRVRVLDAGGAESCSRSYAGSHDRGDAGSGARR